MLKQSFALLAALLQTRSLAIAFSIIAGSAATCGPSSAQVFWGDRPSGGWVAHRSGGWGWEDWGDRHRQKSFFPPFFGDSYNRPAPSVDSAKAPPPRKLETPPASTIMVIGDSLADWLAYGFDEIYAEQPEIGFVRKIAATSGLVRYDAKNDQLDWTQIAKDTLAAEKPNAIIVMLGLNDRLPIREKASTPEPQRKGEQRAQAAQAPQKSTQGEAATSGDSEAAQPVENKTQRPVSGSSYDFQTDEWAALYVKRIDAMMAALKSKGVPVIWVGLPAIRGTKSTSEISYLDELYSERAEKAGIVYVNVWDGFVDDEGRYVSQGPDFEGQIRRLRAADGVHFTKAGAVKLASYVDRDLRRAMSSPVVPVALPSAETTPLSGTGARPDVGPVLLLSSGSGEHGDLVGAEGRSTQTTSDPIAAKVLSRGVALVPPAGRADNFSWPRPGPDANATSELLPQPVALTSDAPTKDAVKDDGRKRVDAKKDAREKSATDSRVSKTRRTPNPDLDGAPIPPAPVGSR